VAWHGKVWLGKARLGLARLGMAWQGVVPRGDPGIFILTVGKVLARSRKSDR